MTPVLWLSVLGASLVGSVHCVGMCGGMVSFATGSLNRKRRVGGHVAYNGGRLVAYLGLGSVAGAFGLGIDSAAARGGVGGGAALVAGSLMIIWALLRLMPPSWGLTRVRAWLPARLGCGFSNMFSRLTPMSPIPRAAVLGVATGLLPCGWLYAFVVAAVATGSVLNGAGILLAFWLGTLPALVGLGSLVQLLSVRVRRLLPTWSAILLLVLGVGNVWSRYAGAQAVLAWRPEAAPGLALTPRPAAENQPTTPAAESELPPCHRH
jgi:sulfite exporter TauE/SafE